MVRPEIRLLRVWIVVSAVRTKRSPIAMTKANMKASRSDDKTMRSNGQPTAITRSGMRIDHGSLPPRRNRSAKARTVPKISSIISAFPRTLPQAAADRPPHFADDSIWTGNRAEIWPKPVSIRSGENRCARTDNHWTYRITGRSGARSDFSPWARAAGCGCRSARPVWPGSEGTGTSPASGRSP